jgi:hypothetical protein
MNNLRKLGGAVVLMFVLSISGFAGEIPSPPGAPGEIPSPPCAPGEMNTPPCASAQSIVDDSALPGQTSTPPASESFGVLSLAEIGLRSLFLF